MYAYYHLWYDHPSVGDEMPSSVWLSHEKQKKLHSFLEHLFSQVSQLNIFYSLAILSISFLTFYQMVLQEAVLLV